MTSNEIFVFIAKALREHDPIKIFDEFFNQVKGTNNASEVKALVSKWHWACGEAKKQLGGQYGIDETFPKSIFCWNAWGNIKKAVYTSVHLRNFQQALGWDIQKIAEGKHCRLAQIIFDAFEKSRRTAP